MGPDHLKAFAQQKKPSTEQKGNLLNGKRYLHLSTVSFSITFPQFVTPRSSKAFFCLVTSLQNYCSLLICYHSFELLISEYSICMFNIHINKLFVFLLLTCLLSVSFKASHLGNLRWVEKQWFFPSSTMGC